jgi:hypothetical protein
MYGTSKFCTSLKFLQRYSLEIKVAVLPFITTALPSILETKELLSANREE